MKIRPRKALPEHLRMVKPEPEYVSKRAAKRLKEGKVAKDVRASEARRRANKKYYEKNKNKLNAKRVARMSSPTGKWKRAKRRAEEKGIPFRLTFDEWWSIWAEAPEVWDEEKKLYRKAYAMHGGNPQKNTQLMRRDTSLGFEIGNVYISYRNQEIPEDGVVREWDIATGQPKKVDPGKII